MFKVMLQGSTLAELAAECTKFAQQAGAGQPAPQQAAAVAAPAASPVQTFAPPAAAPAAAPAAVAPANDALLKLFGQFAEIYQGAQAQATLAHFGLQSIQQADAAGKSAELIPYLRQAITAAGRQPCA